MANTRKKRHPAAFKAKVALEAAKQTRTLAELSKPSRSTRSRSASGRSNSWTASSPSSSDGRRRDHDESQAIQAELYEQIGRLKMEVEWLKKKAARYG